MSVQLQVFLGILSIADLSSKTSLCNCTFSSLAWRLSAWSTLTSCVYKSFRSCMDRTTYRSEYSSLDSTSLNSSFNLQLSHDSICSSFWLSSAFKGKASTTSPCWSLPCGSLLNEHTSYPRYLRSSVSRYSFRFSSSLCEYSSESILLKHSATSSSADF